MAIVVNGTKGDDNIFVDSGNDIIKGGNGNDTIYAGGGNDTITGGKGENTYAFLPNIFNSAAGAGHDVINLTKGENLTLDCTSYDNVTSANIVGKDIILKFSENESILLKNFATKDILGSKGSITLKLKNDLNVDLKEALYATDKFNSKGVLSGNWLSEIISANGLEVGYGKNKDKGVSVKGNNGDDNITGSKFADTLNGGNDDDIITGGAGNDIITGGKGNNTINLTSGFGNDVINLTKGETLEIKYNGFQGEPEYSVSKNDLVVKFGNDSITLKNYYAKETGATVTIDGVNADQIKVLEEVKVNSSKKTGSALADELNATEYKVDAEVIGKGVSLNGAGGYDKLIGSKHNDTLNGGDGNDTLIGNGGNDVITGGKGENIINVDLKTCKEKGLTFGNDIVNLTKGEKLILNIIAEEDATNPNAVNPGNYAIKTNGKDYTITFYQNSNLIQDESGNYVENTNDIIGSITFKNFAAKDILGAQGSLIIKVNDFEMDLVKEIYTIGQYSYEGTIVNIDTIFNNDWVKTGVIKGTRISESINASQYEGVGKKAGKGVTINAGAGNDNIVGSNYNDTIKGGNGNDTLGGGAGNDKLYGETGDNTYVFAVGAGNDTIYAGKGEDTIKFNMSTSSINSIEQLFSKGKGTKDLVISYGDNGDTVTIKDYFTVDKKGNVTGVKSTVTKIETAEGIFTLEDIIKDGVFYIKGENDNDTVYAVKNGAILNGGAGNDTLISGAGNDTLNGGVGNDSLVGGLGKDSIYGGDGDDEISAADMTPDSLNTEDTEGNFIDGGAGNDWIYGSNKNDTIYGGDGEDYIWTYGGNDIIYGGTGKDMLISEDGGSAELYGEEGDDYLELKFANDIGYGGEGNDWISLRNGAEQTAYAGTGNDRIEILQGNATVYGEAGNDTIVGGWSKYGETFNSNIVFANGDGHDTFEYKDGTETLVFDNISSADLTFAQDGEKLVITYADNSSVALENFFKDGVDASKWNVYIETTEGKVLLSEVVDVANLLLKHKTPEGSVAGTVGNDTLTSNDTYKVLYGYKGNDVLNATVASKLYGGEDNDTINGGDYNDTISGQAGDDSVIAGLGNDSISGGAGNDYLNGGDGVDTIIGGDGNDTIYGGAGNDALGHSNSEAGDDEIYGGDGNDTIRGYTGNDKLYGDADDDLIYGGSGDDSIYSGAGNDKIYTNQNQNDKTTDNNYIETGAGNDTVYCGAGHDTIYLGEGKNTVNAFSGDDSIIGGSGNDDIAGGDGNNYIETGSGKDAVTVGTGNNTIIFGSGEKTLYAKSGDDIYEVASIEATKVTSLKDMAGNDIIKLTGDNKDNVNIVFNIDKDGYHCQDPVRIISDTDLAAWKSGTSTSGGISITFDSSEIETITTADGYKLTSADINILKESVVSWLVKNDIADVETALTTGNENQVASLMAVFEQANWQQM